MKKLLRKAMHVIHGPIDMMLSFAILPAAYVLLFFRNLGAARMPRTSNRLKRVGVYPIRDHYYEPLFNNKHLLKPLNEDRSLPGLELNIEGQIAFLAQLQRSNELRAMELERPAMSPLDFSINNGSFESGDAEFLYQVVRHVKPRKVVEIGGGNSTKIVQLALKRNEAESGGSAEHICIEPYEQPWLKGMSGVTLIRERIEKVEIDWSSELAEGDLLFVDSSHIIRPQGDVLVEYLQIFPRLKPGVIVHIHDIFTPKDYLESWVIDDVRFWNEQYLLEALLTNTSRYEVVAALNFLKHHHYEELLGVCPYLTIDREPGSFYFKVRS